MGESKAKTTSKLNNDDSELCVHCQLVPFDLVCTCGDKYDFACIRIHIEQIGAEFQDNHQKVAQHLLQAEDMQRTSRCAEIRSMIQEWQQRRVETVTEIARTALEQVQERENTFSSMTALKDTYDAVSQLLQRIAHEQLNTIIDLDRCLRDKIEYITNQPELVQDTNRLDSYLRSQLAATSNENNIDLASFSAVKTTTSNSSVMANVSPSRKLANSQPSSTQSSMRPQYISTDEASTPKDEFDPGLTINIKKGVPKLISCGNDRHAATLSCHQDELLYNNYDRDMRRLRLMIVPDVNRMEPREISWNILETPVGGGDDNWIQDMAYSNRLRCFLLVNRSRLRTLQSGTYQLEEFMTFPDRSVKRIACTDALIYVICAAGGIAQNGDEIIVLDYDKEEQTCKTFRQLIPSKDQHATYNILVGEISDLAPDGDDHVMIAYRLPRRREVGVCIFNVTENGTEWSCVKQLFLNECWHDDFSYTPRLDWCEQLKVFILIEYMTGHLLMIDQAGGVKGECRFMHVNDRQEPPINLSVSANNWLCVRYESSINLHQIFQEG